MKISLNWLNDYIDVKKYFAQPEELGELLTAAGLELEAVESLGAHLDNVVVGHIKEFGKHPDADRLTLCQVDVGKGKTHQIICGAKNHKLGDKVVVTLPGAVLPGNFAIKVSKIRGVESQGMLASEKELGLSEESEGIKILPEDAPVGMPFREYAKLDDVVLELNVTPNRADCLSHIGLAREVSCLLNKKLKMPKDKVSKTSGSVKNSIDVQLIDKDLCPRYAGRIVKGVKVGPSPEWLRTRLEAVGVNSINNIVDITNYVMMEYGQPLHAFDMKHLRGGIIKIERATKGEVFTSLDGTEYKLNDEPLTIRDGMGPVALAGVVGGKNSGVSEDTVDIFIEAAHFTPISVRRTSRRMGIDTDSAYRFSRGTDPDGVVAAMNRAAYLVQEIAGGEVSKDHVDRYPKKTKKKTITVRHETLEARLGYKVSMQDFGKWMKRLHCKVNVLKSQAKVDVPSFRWDLEQEMDLVEEYARLHGYDHIPETFPELATQPSRHDKVYETERRLRQSLTAEGYMQAVNYNFLSPTWQKKIVDADQWTKLGLKLEGDAVALKNPLSEETGVMRQSLLPSLLTNLIYNHHHGSQFGRLFEVGPIFYKRGETHQESFRVAFMAWGRPEGIWQKESAPLVYELKTSLENLLKGLQSKAHQWKPLAAAPEIVHPGQASGLFYQGKNIGFMGSLHPAFKEEHKIRVDVALAELDVSALFQGQPKQVKFKKISKLPAVDRDISFQVPKNLSAQDIIREMKKQGGELVTSVAVFDLYEGNGIDEGHRALAFRLIYQAMDQTLSDDQVSEHFKKLVDKLTAKFPIKPR